MQLRYLLTSGGLFSASVFNQLEFAFRDYSKIITYDNVLNLAKMANNAYYVDTTNNWIPVPPYNWTDIDSNLDFIRGYVFIDNDTKTYIVSFKGTNVLPYEETRKYDKYNDNLFFSCCFNKTGYNYDSTCKECNQKCYKNTLNDPNNYINSAKMMIQRLRDKIDFDNSTIVFTGHSLGGAIATYMGILYNKTVVTFQTPGEKHYLEMTNLVTGRSLPDIYHFGHNNDPIFTGDCGWWCKMGGYYIDTYCHLGYVCKFNTSGYSSLLKHRMSYVIDVMLQTWNGTLPKCQLQTDCSDC